MKKIKPIIEHKREFRCENCDPNCTGEPMRPKEAVEHLKTIHKIEDFKGEKKMLQALDGEGFYSNVYEWHLNAPAGPVKMVEVHSGPKGKRDLP